MAIQVVKGLPVSITKRSDNDWDVEELVAWSLRVGAEVATAVRCLAERETRGGQRWK